MQPLNDAETPIPRLLTVPSLRSLAKSPWAVRDLGEQLMVSTGQFVAYFDSGEDCFVPTESENCLPRTAAIAVIGSMLASGWGSPGSSRRDWPLAGSAGRASPRLGESRTTLTRTPVPEVTICLLPGYTYEMTWFKPRNLLDRTFELGVALKGINGALELFGGLLLLAVRPDSISRLVTALTQSELSEDPHDFFASRLLNTAHGLTGSSAGFGGLYLLSHGLVKIVLVLALLKNKLWAYPWMIVFLLVFIVYQLYRIALDHSTGLVALTVFDAGVAWLTYREYRQHRARFAQHGP